MKDVERSTVLKELKKDAIRHSRDTFFFNPPLSDFEILKFQNLILTPSVHYITTKNVKTGRSLINKFLLTFKHYHNVGCLSMDKTQNLLDHVYDLSTVQKTNIPLIDSIELFCIENPYLNFVWIELTHALQNKISEGEMRKICELFSSDAQTPVVLLSYEEEPSFI